MVEKKREQDADGGKNPLLLVSDAIIGAAVLVVVGMWAGAFLDRKLNTTPWLSLLCSLIGAGLGLWRMVAKAMELDKSTTKAPTKK